MAALTLCATERTLPVLETALLIMGSMFAEFGTGACTREAYGVRPGLLLQPRAAVSRLLQWKPALAQLFVATLRVIKKEMVK